jgi:uncharacterized protein YgiM (DUF1202 family)
VIGGNDYFHCKQTYYQRVPNGYAVVEAPRKPSISTKPLHKPFDKPIYKPSQNSWDKSSRVSVKIRSLNVRSGPGKKFSVIDRVHYGNSLIIEDISYEWIYVKTPHGKNGWVMKKYTSPERHSVPMHNKPKG